MNEIPSQMIAQVLARIWHWHRSPEFLRYLAENFHECFREPAEFDRLYVYEAGQGDAARGHMLFSSIQRWWAIDDAGFQESGRPDCIQGWVDAPKNLRGVFYRTPWVGFLRQGQNVAIGESFGPGLLSRKFGRLQKSEKGLEITDVQMVYPERPGWFGRLWRRISFPTTG